MFPLARFKISDNSMLPNFKEGDFVLVNKLFFNLKENEVIVFEKENRFLIKRVGKIEGNKIFVVSDNPAGQDSRHFGPISKNEIIGKVIFRAKG